MRAAGDGGGKAGLMDGGVRGGVGCETEGGVGNFTTIGGVAAVAVGN
jgi:hypothetical protein